MFGSRSGGNPHSESDWDFLVITEKPVSRIKRIEAQNAVLARCAHLMIDVELIVKDYQSVQAQADTAGALVHTALNNGVSCD